MKYYGDQEGFGFSITKFLIFSVLIHIIFFAGIYFAPPAKEKKQRELITNLVTEEKKKAEVKKPQKKEKQFLAKPVPAIPIPARPVPVVPLPARPAPIVPRQEKAVPQPPPVIARPLSKPSQQDLPLVPGEVKEVGKPSQGTGSPRIGKGGGKGEADVRDTRNAVESAKPGSPGKPNLFDAGVTEAIARKDTGKVGNKIKKDDVITFDTSIYRYAGYMNKLRDRIQSVWKYPPEAAAKGISADLKIRFTIKKDGRLGAVELMSTSGYPMLDDAAVKALKDGEPYWPLPSDWGMDTYTIEGHFIYSLYGYYLR